MAGFIVPKCMLVYYGSEINGLVSSILQFIAYFNLVEAGISGAAVYELYKPLAEDDHEGVSRVVSAARSFYMQSGYVFLVLVSILAIVYPFYIKTNLLTFFEMAALVFVLGMNGCLEFFTLAKYRSLLTADQKTYVISSASIVYIILQTFFVVILSKMRVNIVVLRTFVLLAILVRSAVMIFYCRKRYPYVNYYAAFPKNILDKRWDALVLQILGAMHVGAPVVILTIVLKDLKIVSVYSVYNMIIGGISGILGIFISGLAASFGDVIARHQQNVLQKACREFECVYYSLISVVYGISLVTLPSFVKIYTNGVVDTDYNLPFVGVLFVINAFLYNVKTPQGMLVISAGMYRETRWQTALQGAIMVFGGLLFAPFWGIYGVLAASILSNIYRDVDLMFFIPKYLTKMPVTETFTRILLAFGKVFLIWAVCKTMFENAVNSYLSWALFAAKTTLLACVLVLLLMWIFERKNLLGIISRIQDIVRR